VLETRDFLESRRQAYQNVGLWHNWHLRGIAYLAEHCQMLLAAQVHLPTKDNNNSNDSNDTRGQVVIHNVHPAALEERGHGAPARSDCHLLEVWVRVRGAEVLAGGATAVQPENPSQNCYWVFDFDLYVAGEYIVESKVLLWNGQLQHDGTNKCTQVRQGTNVSHAIMEKFPVHYGFRGFKLYSPGTTCCEFCSRQRNPPCRYWSSPPVQLMAPSTVANGCEFYFDKGTQPQDVPFLSPILGDLPVHNFSGFDLVLGKRPRRHLQELQHHVTSLGTDPSKHRQRRRLKEVDRAHGYPHNRSTAYFVGCGWHQMFTLDFPCLSGALDDQVYLSQPTFSFGRSPPPATTPQPLLPLCQHHDELLNHSNGRWVKESWPNETQCPMPFQYDAKFSQRFKISKNDGDHPHCWHRDDLTTVGYQCAEMNCRFIWDKSRWTSSFREKQFMTIWRQYGCDYYEYTDAQLQQCMDVQKISEFKFDGRSVAASFEQNVNLRLQHLNLYNKALPDAKRVTLSTLMLLHLTVKSYKEVYASWDRTYRNLTDHPNELVYIANGFYLTSERETFCFVDRMREFNIMLEDYFLPRGYHVLNAFDVSTAVSYETAGQFDGMHLMGPAMKTITNKLFHYLCQDVVEGTRM